MWELDNKRKLSTNQWFQIVVLEKTLESPLDCMEISTFNPKKINPEYSLEGLMLILSLPYFGQLMQKSE